MQITLDVPDDIAAHLGATEAMLSRATIEALALEGYRSRKLSSDQIQQLLGFTTPMEVHDFLKEKDVYRNTGLEEREELGSTA